MSRPLSREKSRAPNCVLGSSMPKVVRMPLRRTGNAIYKPVDRPLSCSYCSARLARCYVNGCYSHESALNCNELSAAFRVRCCCSAGRAVIYGVSVGKYSRVRLRPPRCEQRAILRSTRLPRATPNAWCWDAEPGRWEPGGRRVSHTGEKAWLFRCCRAFFEIESLFRRSTFLLHLLV